MNTEITQGPHENTQIKLREFQNEVNKKTSNPPCKPKYN